MFENDNFFGVLDCNDLIQGLNPDLINEPTACTRLEIVKVTFHPDSAEGNPDNYVSQSIFDLNDVAVIELALPSDVTPASELLNNIVTEIGWGADLPILNSDSKDGLLREVDTLVIENEECSIGYENLRPR